MNVRLMLQQALLEQGFDGLVEEDSECACQSSDLAPCESDFSNCVPGYKIPCTCGMGCAFHITRFKPEVKYEDTTSHDDTK